VVEGVGEFGRGREDGGVPAVRDGGGELLVELRLGDGIGLSFACGEFVGVADGVEFGGDW